MDLTDIKFIKDLCREDDVNRHIQKGWKLINIHTVSYDPDIAPNDLRIHYILGATNDVDLSDDLEKLNARNYELIDF